MMMRMLYGNTHSCERERERERKINFSARFGCGCYSNLVKYHAENDVSYSQWLFQIMNLSHQCKKRIRDFVYFVREAMFVTSLCNKQFPSLWFDFLLILRRQTKSKKKKRKRKRHFFHLSFIFFSVLACLCVVFCACVWRHTSQLNPKIDHHRNHSVLLDCIYNAFTDTKLDLHLIFSFSSSSYLVTGKH